MNNNMNNNFNNQPMNNQNTQPVNNNPVTQQFVSNPQINNPVQNNQATVIPTEQQYQQPVQPQTMHQQPLNPTVQQFQQPVNNVNPNMNQSYNYNNISNNINGKKEKNNKTLFIIIGISVAVVLAIVILVLILGSKDKTVNEYEENGNNNITNNENTTPTTQDEKSYKGFKFTKISGYIYGEESGLMTVQNNNNIVMLGVTKVPFSLVKANYTSLISTLTSSGWTVGQSKIDTYNGTEVVTFETTLNGISGLYYVIAAPNSDYVYEGFTTNIAYTIDYTDINLVVDVSKASTYVGDYSDYSTDFGVDFELKDVQ